MPISFSFPMRGCCTMCTTALVLLSLFAQLSPPAADPKAKAQALGLLTEGAALVSPIAGSTTGFIATVRYKS